MTSLRRRVLDWWDSELRRSITMHGTQPEPNRAGFTPAQTPLDSCATPPIPAVPVPASGHTAPISPHPTTGTTTPGGADRSRYPHPPGRPGRATSHGNP